MKRKKPLLIMPEGKAECGPSPEGRDVWQPWLWAKVRLAVLKRPRAQCVEALFYVSHRQSRDQPCPADVPVTVEMLFTCAIRCSCHLSSVTIEPLKGG